jgi:hypothetical protein
VAQPAGAFDRATGVEHRGDGTYAVTIDDGWAIGGIPNGGYLLATLGRAALAAGAAAEGPDHPHVMSATALYVSPSPPGPAAIATEVLRRGRRVRGPADRTVRTAQLSAIWKPGSPHSGPSPAAQCTVRTRGT